MLPRTPRTDPGVRNSRTGLPPWVTDGEALAGPRVSDAGSGEPAIFQYGHPLPVRRVLLAAPAKRAPPEVGQVVAEVPQGAGVGRDRVIGEEAPARPAPASVLARRSARASGGAAPP